MPRMSLRTNRPYSKSPDSKVYEHFLDINNKIIHAVSDLSKKVAGSFLRFEYTSYLLLMNAMMYGIPLHILG